MCVVDFVGVHFFIEVHTEIKSNFVCMGKCSYIGQIEVQTHEMTFYGGHSRNDVFF